MVNLRTLLTKFQPANDRETTTAYFQTHVPWVAPEAYLNIIYKPATPQLLSTVGMKLNAPKPYIEFAEHHNGAMLLSGSFGVYGVVAPGTLLKRSDPYSLPPLNIESENRNWPPPDRDRWLKIGGYGYDGSGVCIDRQSLEIAVFRRGEKIPGARWRNLDQWLTTEIERLSGMFDSTGKRLGEAHETLPYSAK